MSQQPNYLSVHTITTIVILAIAAVALAWLFSDLAPANVQAQADHYHRATSIYYVDDKPLDCLLMRSMMSCNWEKYNAFEEHPRNIKVKGLTINGNN